MNARLVDIAEPILTDVLIQQNAECDPLALISGVGSGVWGLAAGIPGQKLHFGVALGGIKGSSRYVHPLTFP